MSELTILDNTIRLFERPGTWCRGSLALDLEGNSVLVTSPQASRWCLRGALLRYYQYRNPGEFKIKSEFENCILAIKNSINEIHPEPFPSSITDFNDSVAKDVEDVLKVLRNTRKYLNKEER